VANNPKVLPKYTIKLHFDCVMFCYAVFTWVCGAANSFLGEDLAVIISRRRTGISAGIIAPPRVRASPCWRVLMRPLLLLIVF